MTERDSNSGGSRDPLICNRLTLMGRIPHVISFLPHHIRMSFLGQIIFAVVAASSQRPLAKRTGVLFHGRLGPSSPLKFPVIYAMSVCVSLVSFPPGCIEKQFSAASVAHPNLSIIPPRIDLTFTNFARIVWLGVLTASPTLPVHHISPPIQRWLWCR